MHVRFAGRQQGPAAARRGPAGCRPPQALARIGLVAGTAYLAPALVRLDQANAQSVTTSSKKKPPKPPPPPPPPPQPGVAEPATLGLLGAGLAGLALLRRDGVRRRAADVVSRWLKKDG